MTELRNQIICLLTHQTQYDPPFWNALLLRGQLEPIVYYSCHRAAMDQDVGEVVRWRADFAGGIASELASVPEALERHRTRCAAVLVPGWTKTPTWRAFAWCQSRRIPVILPSDKTLNEPGPRGAARWVDWMFHTARSGLFDAFFTTGTLGIQALRSLGIPRERIAAGLYPIDLKWWRHEAESATTRGQAFRATLGGDKVFLAVCELNQPENPRLIVEAFDMVARSMPGARLVMAGSGLEGEVADAVAKRGLASRVKLVGWVPYENLAQYYVAADVFVHAPMREPWGGSVSEAMACGLTVAATTTVGCAADLVIPGRTGALAWPNDPTSLAEAMRASAALTDQPGAQAAIAGAVARVDVDAAAMNLEELVQGLSKEARWTAWPTRLKSEAHNIYGKWPL